MVSRRKIWAMIALKWACYTGILLVAGVLQTTPESIYQSPVKPIFILPVCLAVALCEGEYEGAFFGAVGGMMWDFTSARTVGLFALMTMVVCFTAATLVHLYLRRNLTNFALLCASACLLLVGMDFLFNYLMRGYGAVVTQVLGHLLPICGATALVSPVAYWLANLVHRNIKQPE